MQYNTKSEVVFDVAVFCEENGYEDVFDGKASKTKLVKFLADPAAAKQIFSKIIISSNGHGDFSDMDFAQRHKVWSDFLAQSGLNSEGFQTAQVMQETIQMMAREMVKIQLASQS